VSNFVEISKLWLALQARCTGNSAGIQMDGDRIVLSNAALAAASTCHDFIDVVDLAVQQRPDDFPIEKADFFSFNERSLICRCRLTEG
jgi:hypothetical protein